MPFRTKIFILLLFLLAIASGYNYFYHPFSEEPVEQQVVMATPVPDSAASLEERIFEKLSTEEKVEQLIAFPIQLNRTATPEAELVWLENNNPGLITVFGSNVSREQLDAMKNRVYADRVRFSTDPMLAVDHEGGSVQRLRGEGFTALPAWRELCAEEDVATRTAQLKQAATELADAGIRVVYAPVLDTLVAGASLQSRACSADRAIIAQRGGEFIEVFAQAGIVPVIKHFPNIGAVRQDLHTGFGVVSIAPDDVIAFRSVLEEFPKVGVMIAHVGVKNQNPDVPCTFSSDCVGELKNNFSEVLVFSDGLEMQSAQGTASGSAQLKALPQLSIEAVKAGNDILVYGQGVTATDIDEVVALLVRAYDEDELVKARVDESVMKVLSYKNR